MKFTFESWEELLATFPQAAHLQTYRYYNPSPHASVRVEDLLLGLSNLGASRLQDYPENLRLSVTIPPKESAVVPSLVAQAIHPVTVDQFGRRTVAGGYGTRLERIDPPEDYVHRALLPAFNPDERKAANRFITKPVAE